MKFFTATLRITLLLASLISSAYCQIPTVSIGVFGGAGLQHDNVNRGALQAGASLDESVSPTFGFLFEGGYVGPFSNPHGGSAIFSANYLSEWNTSLFSTIAPFATGGYTRLFGTGNAVNFGAGIDFLRNSKFGIRLEGRDYYTFSTPQHCFAIRIGFHHNSYAD